MRTIKGPGIFLAQFLGDKAPFDALEPIAKWAAELGYLGLQVPVFERLSAPESLWRIRVGSYRVIYQIQSSQLILRVSHRRDVYRQLDRLRHR